MFAESGCFVLFCFVSIKMEIPNGIYRLVFILRFLVFALFVAIKGLLEKPVSPQAICFRHDLLSPFSFLGSLCHNCHLYSSK